MNSEGHSENGSWAGYLLAIAAIVAVGYFAVPPQTLYKPGDNFGYNNGLAGGLMMVFSALYHVYAVHAY